MRYLKTYKLFETFSDRIVPQIEDIALYLRDDGFEVGVENTSMSSGMLITIGKEDNSPFNYSDVSETVDHIVSFLKGEDYGLDYIEYNTEDDETNILEYNPLRSVKKAISYKDDVCNLIDIHYIQFYFKFNLNPFRKNESVDINEPAEYIKDICRYLKDDGFNICGSSLRDLYDEPDAGDVISLHSYQSMIEINKFDNLAWKPSAPTFEISEVYDAVCTIISYMESKGYKTTVLVSNPDIELAARRHELNDITIIIDKIRNADNWEHGKNNLKGLGPIRYIKLYFKKPQTHIGGYKIMPQI